MATNMECSAQTVSGKINGHEYVDLGLPSGLKWATQNIGATKPSDDGDYFAWGDKESGYSFSCDQYKWSDRKSSHEPIDFYNVDNIDLFQITKYGEKAAEILDALLTKYADSGLTDLENVDVLKVDPLKKYGTQVYIINTIFGGIAKYHEAIKELETAIYAA